MITENILVTLLLTAGSAAFNAQSNTASFSGSIGKCAVWSYPYTLYNTSGASQEINDGVTVTVDQDRNIGAVNFSGTGAMNMSGTKGITLSGSGSEINCRWDIGGGGSYTIVNNDGVGSAANPRNLGTFFTAPYSGTYYWNRKTGWSASFSGAYSNGSINLHIDTSGTESAVFYQNQAGSCGLLGGTDTPAIWEDTLGPIPLSAGGGLSYTIGTGYNSKPGCTNTTLNMTRGAATMKFDN